MMGVYKIVHRNREAHLIHSGNWENDHGRADVLGEF